MKTFKFIITKVDDPNYSHSTEVKTDISAKAVNLINILYPANEGYKYSMIEK